MYHLTALVTLLAVLVYFYSSILVSRARGKFGVKLPAISGNAVPTATRVRPVTAEMWSRSSCPT